MKNILIVQYSTEKTDDLIITEKVSAELKALYPETTILRASNLGACKKTLQDCKNTLVIYIWRNKTDGYRFLEYYYDELRPTRPFVVIFSHLDPDEQMIMREFRVFETVRYDAENLPKVGKEINAYFRDFEKPNSPKIIKKIFEMQIMRCYTSGDFERGDKFFEKLKSNLTTNEINFFQGLRHIENKEYEKAVNCLNSGSELTLKSADLLGQAHFLNGSYKEALRFWRSVKKKSPLNLKRNLMIFRCYNNLSKTDEMQRGLAMKSLLDLYKIAPDYEGVCKNIIQSAINYQSVELLPILKRLLLQTSTKELKPLMKSIKKLNDPFKSEFIDSYVRALSIRANELVKADDHTAVTFYKYIGRLIPDSDMPRKIALEYSLARAYFRFGLLDMASEGVNKVLELTDNSHEKAGKLKILVEKAMRGEFDVLTDDESEWLSPKNTQAG